MSAALPTAAIVTGEYRALTLYDVAPADCGTHRLPDDAFAPHLQAGELAVIDPEDREPTAGEIYLVTIDDPREPDGHKLDLVQLRPRPFGAERELGWMMHFTLIRHYGRRLSVDDIVAKLRSGEMSVCDGPLNDRGMREKIVGRVIGIEASRGLPS